MTTNSVNIVLSVRRALLVGSLFLATSAFGQRKHTEESRIDLKAPARSETVSLVTGAPQHLLSVVAGTPPTAKLMVNPVPAKVGAYPAGTKIVYDNELWAPEGNFRAWFEFQLSDWDPNRDGDPALLVWQVKIDASGYLGSDDPGNQPDITAPVIPCANNCTCATVFGESWANCESGFCEHAYVDVMGTGRPDSWCADTGQGSCNANYCATGTLNTSCSAVYSGMRPDDGTVKYLATLVLDIPAGAKGRYTVSLNTDETFIANTSFPPEDIPTVSEAGFIVDIVTGMCCYGFGTPSAGCIDRVTEAECGDDEPPPFIFEQGRICENPPGSDGCAECLPFDPLVCSDNDACTTEWCNIFTRCERRPIAGFDPETECCHPFNRTQVTRIDADQCTTDTCSVQGSQLVVQHTVSPLGTLCNDWNACTVNDACDGVRTEATGGCGGTDLYTAACENTLCPETNPNGVPCDDLNPCTINDVCDALRECRGTTVEGCEICARTPINCACDGPATRSIALFVPSSAPEFQTALQVRLEELQSPDPPNLPQFPPPDFSGYESGATCGDPSGCVRWVGKPGSFLESQDSPAQGSFKAARLQCTPFYHNWWTEAGFRVVGAEIIPSSTYTVQSFFISCMGNETTCTDVSAPLQVMTGRYGDVAAPFNAPPVITSQPNAIDIVQVVNKVKGLMGAPSKAMTQLQPNLPEFNADLNALDILAAVDAVKQLAYAFSGPCPCPSVVKCGPAQGSVACTTSTSCVTAFGAGAMCVKTCSGGANQGNPCINNSHCPGSVCGAGFCRDACGRCTP